MVRQVKMDEAQTLTTTRTARSIDEAMEKMENAKIRCWNKTHKRMKWRLALRIATSPRETVSESCRMET